MTERCEQIFPDLSAMLDGEVDDDVRASVDVHVAECATCAERLHQLQALRQELRDMADGDPTPGFAEATARHVVGQPSPRPRPWWRFW